MREGIAQNRGYEIGTEGDSFHIAFCSVPEAVCFCMEAQMRLLETNWPREVLKLGPCKTVADSSKEVLFRGPRVRMSIHWAVEGTIAHRSGLLDLFTSHHRLSASSPAVCGCDWCRIIPQGSACSALTHCLIPSWQLSGAACISLISSASLTSCPCS